MVNERFLNYSQLLSNLIEEKEEKLNEGTIAFLYQLFPNDMFVKAFSLLESSTIFLYIWNSEVIQPKYDTSHESIGIGYKSQPQDRLESWAFEAGAGFDSIKPSKPASPEDDVFMLFESIYQTDSNRLTRIIVQQVEEASAQELICIDVDSWSCSCHEYAECLANPMNSTTNAKSSNEYFTEKFDLLERFNENVEDKFAKIKPGVHVNVNRILCEHLLAASILLKTSTRVLAYFAMTKKTVSVLSVNNRDDWLKLHLNLLE